MRFHSQFLVRFSHCDPAGIVYFVNFFDMIHAVVEDWFADALNAPLHTVLLDRRWGFPAVDTRCEFMSPCQLGDHLVLELSVVKIGTSSLTLQILGRVGDQEKLKAQHTVVMISLDSRRSIPIPSDLRSEMSRYLEPAADDV